MLTFCGFLILMLIGFMFVKEDNKKKMIKIIKDNSTLIGAGLVLLFLINSISGYGSNGNTVSYTSVIEGLSHKIEGLGHDDDPPTKSTCGSS